MSTLSKRKRHPKHFLKEWRQFRFMTQQQLADKSNTSKSLISRYETGSFDWNTTTFLALVAALDIRPDELFVKPIPSLRDEQRMIRERNAFNKRRAADIAEP
jgi:transcriptional regulator with XRE-family HTH domain